VDLRIARGETVALLGRNGAGKSTTIALLLGLTEPDEGRVELFDGPPEASVRAGRVGAMLQEGRAVPRVTVRELVTFVAGRYPAPMPVARALEPAGIADLAGRRVDRLSGGQTQRVRFAVALAGNPALIVLDEPTAALDVEARHAFWASMRSYARLGHTVLFSTHHLEIAALLWLGSVPFTLLGLGNGYRLTGQTTGVANMACNLGLAVLGGLWFPVTLFPGWLRTLSGYTPTYRFAQLGTSVAAGHAPALGALAVLTLWLPAFGSYAVLSYRRSAGNI